MVHFVSESHYISVLRPINIVLRNFEMSVTAKRSRPVPDRYGESEKVKSYDHHFSGEINVENEKATHREENLSDLSENEILETINKMTVTINYLSEKVNSFKTAFKNRSTLQLKENDVLEEELPQLNKFETFKMPISDLHDLERLEEKLKDDRAFYVFFVSLNFFL